MLNNKLLRTFLILFAFALLPSVRGVAQVKQIGSPFIKTFTPKDYLEDPQNWAAVQDHRGLLFFGNTNGILEYDGNYWRTYALGNASAVRALAVDSLGTVYAGGIGDIGFLQIQTKGELAYRSLFSLIPKENQDFKDVNNVFTTKDGVYFISLKYVFRWHKNRLTVIENGSEFKESFKLGDAIVVLTASNVYSFSKNTLIPMPALDKFALSGSKHSFLLKSNPQQYLIIDEKLGFFEYDVLKNRLTPLPITDCVPFLQKYGLNKALVFKSKTIAIATNGGLVIINEKGHILQHINQKSGLLTDLTTNLFVDKRQTLWVTLDGGLAFVKPDAPVTSFGLLDGVGGTSLSMLDTDERYYIGTTTGLYSMPHRAFVNGVRVSSFATIPEIHSAVWKVAKFKNMVIACSTQGIYFLRNSKVLAFVPTHKTYDFIVSPKRPDLIFFAQYTGICYAEVSKIESGMLKSTDIKPIDACRSLAWNFTLDNQGAIWASSFYKGVYKIELGESENFKVSLFNSAHGIPLPYVNLYVFQRHDSIYLSTPKGLYATSVKDSKTMFHPLVYQTLDSVNYNFENVSQVIIDESNRVWSISKKSVGYFSKEKNTYKWIEVPFLDKPTYVHSLSLLENAAWFCTNEGVYRYDYMKSNQNKFSFHVTIRKVESEENTLVFGGNLYFEDSVGAKLPTLVQRVKYVPIFKGQSSLRFEYAADAYEKAQSTQYSFQLKGFESKWSEWSQRSSKEYTNMGMGGYTFMVRARDVYGNISNVASYSFRVVAPWYKTPIALILYFTLFMMGIYWVVRYNIYRLKQANLRLEEIVAQRTSEVENQKYEIEQQAQDLKKSNLELAKLSIVASKTDNAIFITDKSGDFIWLNDGFTRIYGYDLESLQAEIGPNIKDASVNPDILELLRICVCERISIHYESQNSHKNGSLIWAQTTITPVVNDANEVVQLVAIETEITKIKEAEQEIVRKSEELRLTTEKLEETNKELEKLSVVARETDNVIIIMDAQGNYEWVNESFTKVFGYTLAQLTASKGGNIKNTRKLDVVEDIVRCIEEKVSVQYDFKTHTQDGTEIWINAVVTPILDDLGNVVKLIGVDTNITRIKQAEFELQRQAEVIGEQASRVNKQNEHIVSSIKYAQTIQKAILPTESNIAKSFESFTIFQPKDIVSGDFVWFSRRFKGFAFIAVVDCTGHGVPGAFMSMIGSRLLNEIVNEKQIHELPDILEQLDAGIKQALKQTKTDNNDGMDVCLCKVIDPQKDTRQVEFCGAKRPLIYCSPQDTAVQVVKGNRRTIGGIRSVKGRDPFEMVNFTFDRGTMLYLTTDGLIDQHGHDRKRFGSPLLYETIMQMKNFSVVEQEQILLERLRVHQGEESQRDDITFMGIRL